MRDSRFMVLAATALLLSACGKKDNTSPTETWGQSSCVSTAQSSYHHSGYGHPGYAGPQQPALAMARPDVYFTISEFQLQYYSAFILQNGITRADQFWGMLDPLRADSLRLNLYSGRGGGWRGNDRTERYFAKGLIQIVRGGLTAQQITITSQNSHWQQRGHSWSNGFTMQFSIVNTSRVGSQSICTNN